MNRLCTSKNEEYKKIKPTKKVFPFPVFPVTAICGASNKAPLIPSATAKGFRKTKRLEACMYSSRLVFSPCEPCSPKTSCRPIYQP